jgi:hypothetical protein
MLTRTEKKNPLLQYISSRDLTLSVDLQPVLVDLQARTIPDTSFHDKI